MHGHELDIDYSLQLHTATSLNESMALGRKITRNIIFAVTCEARVKGLKKHDGRVTTEVASNKSEQTDLCQPNFGHKAQKQRLNRFEIF